MPEGQVSHLTLPYTNTSFKSARSHYGVGYSTEGLDLIIPDIVLISLQFTL
jgi:hypothetical protein